MKRTGFRAGFTHAEFMEDLFGVYLGVYLFLQGSLWFLNPLEDVEPLALITGTALRVRATTEHRG